MTSPAPPLPTDVPCWTRGPATFGDSLAEDRAAREGAAQFDLSGRTRLIFTGRDRAKFLHGFCTNSVTTLKPGEGCEAFVTNIKGRILDHLFIAAGETAILVDATRGNEEKLFAHLDRYLITEDVQIERRSADAGELFVSGPRAASALAEAGLSDLEGLAPDAHRTLQFGAPKESSPLAPREEGRAHDDRLTRDAGPTEGAPPIDPGRDTPHAPSERPSSRGARGLLSLTEPLEIIAWRVDLLGTPGFRLLVPRDRVEEVAAVLAAAGIPRAGSDVFEPLRIVAGLPLYGVDLSEDNLAQEAMRTPRAISFKKGCYLGQEPIARIDALGHVNRQLAGVWFPAGPHTGKLASADGQEIGTITSAAQPPGRSDFVALAMLKSQYATGPDRPLTPAMAVRVVTPEGLVPAGVFHW